MSNGTCSFGSLRAYSAALRDVTISSFSSTISSCVPPLFWFISIGVELEPNNRLVTYVLYRLNQRSSMYAIFYENCVRISNQMWYMSLMFCILEISTKFPWFLGRTFQVLYIQVKLANTFFQLMWTYFNTALSLPNYLLRILPKCKFNGVNLLAFKEITPFYHLLSYSVMSGSEPHPTITQNPRIHLHLMVSKLPVLFSFDPIWKEAC